MRLIFLLNFVLQIILIYGRSKWHWLRKCDKKIPTIEDIYKKVEFSLTSSQNSTFHFDLNVNIEDLIIHGFDPEKPTKILIHGYKTSGLGWFCPHFIKAYEPNEFNIICLDWYYFAHPKYKINHLPYVPVPGRSIAIGEIIGEIFITKKILSWQNPDLIHMIGWSAGAQMAGQIGKVCINTKVQKLATR